MRTVVDGDVVLGRDDEAVTRPFVYEREVLAALPDWHGFGYSLTSVGYAHDMDELAEPTVADGAPRMTNCTVFVEDLLVHLFAIEPWGSTRNRAAQIRTNDLYGNITAFDVAEVGVQVPDFDDWTLCQGWRKPTRSHKKPRGHAFIVARVDGEKLLILEANKANGVDGVGFRGIGNLDALEPGWTLDSLVQRSEWTRERVRTMYGAGIKMLRLKVMKDPDYSPKTSDRLCRR